MISAYASTLADAASRLREDEIHVWQLNYRRERGREPLRAALAAYLGIDAADVALIDGEHGRPALAAEHDSSLGFNWSHSGPHALLAVGRQVMPGVDLEVLRSRPRALDIAERYFSVDETAVLKALPAAQRSAAFLELWTAKEAVLKALGRGLAFGLHRLSIANNDGELTLQHLDGHDVCEWQLQRLPLGDSLVAALAWRGGARQVRLGILASAD